MFENTFALLLKENTPYRKTNTQLHDLGVKAKKEVDEFYKKLQNNLFENGCLKKFYIYKKKAQWQRGYSSKITDYFNLILKHNDFPQIGSTIDFCFYIKNNQLILSNGISMEYDQNDKMYDPIIQSSLVKFANKNLCLNKYTESKYKWNNLEKLFIISNFDDEEQLIKKLISTTKKLISIFLNIINENKNESIEYKFVESNHNVNEVHHTPSQRKGFVDGVNKAKVNKNIGDFSEALILKAETEKLKKLNLKPLKVNGDSYGFDIKSFDEKGNEIFIEVKGTNGRRSSVFYLTANEVEAAKIYSNKWFLYRVYVEDDKYCIEKFDAQTVLKYFLNNPSQYEVSLK